MKLPPAVLNAFHRGLAAWYLQEKRDLPWRRTRDPYAIVVSEFMCQQTQVATVIPYFQRWMERFPTWESLASSDESAVLKLWEGLGYYRRARFLHALAQEVAGPRQGRLPRSAAELARLPGIGPYMAGAVASIAFGERAPLVDGNVERVFARVFAWDEPARSSAMRKRFWDCATALLPVDGCGDHNQSLMELGARICTPRKPQCLLCPLRGVCRGSADPERYPVIERPATVEMEKTYAVVRRDGAVWLLHPDAPGLWKGLHRLPEWDEAWMHGATACGTLTIGITKHRIRARVVHGLPGDRTPEEGGWHDEASMTRITLPAPHRKMWKMAQEAAQNQPTALPKRRSSSRSRAARS